MCSGKQIGWTIQKYLEAITTHLGKCLQNTIGIVFIKASLSGHLINGLSFTNNTSITRVKIQLIVELCTLNQYPRSWVDRFRRNLINVIKICWNGDNDDLPVLLQVRFYVHKECHEQAPCTKTCIVQYFLAVIFKISLIHRSLF